jgi:hypothetical protein
MAIKTPLKESDEPLKEGQNYFAACGDVVPQAAFVMEFDCSQVGFPAINGELRGLSLCVTCRKVQLTRRYLYALRSGDEAKQTEAV